MIAAKWIALPPQDNRKLEYPSSEGLKTRGLLDEVKHFVLNRSLLK